jgi:hypothetical protein
LDVLHAVYHPWPQSNPYIKPEALSRVPTSLALTSESVKPRPMRTRGGATSVAVGGTSSTSTVVVVVLVAPSASVTVSVTVYVRFCPYVFATVAPIAVVSSPKFHW